MTNIYEEGFEEFIEEGLSAENKKHYRTAASNYYKAVSEMCSFLIKNKTGKNPNNHSEIFLFLKVNFLDLYDMINPAFEVYTKAYDSEIKEEDCKIIKEVIKKIANREEISEKIRNVAEKI
jgi:hypothetical protein